jgi:hypothetical protein
MSKRIVPVVTVTVSLIIELIENWNEETAVGLLNNVVENGDFQNTNVSHWKPILSGCEEYLKGKFDGNIENFEQVEEEMALEKNGREKLLAILGFLTKVVENVKDASTYPFKLGWPLMNLTYYFDLEVATQASFLLAEICSDGAKIELLFEDSLPNYDKFIRLLIGVGDPPILQSFDRRVHDFYGCIQNSRVGDCGETNIDERLARVKYDMKRMITYQYEFFGASFYKEINEASKLKEHLDLLKKETVSLQLKFRILRYVRSLFKCVSKSGVSLADDSKRFLEDFVLSLWEIAISNTTPIDLVPEIMNSLECFVANAYNLDPFLLITNFSDFVVKNLEGTSSCEEEKELEVLKCFIKILERRSLKEGEIRVIVKGIGVIVPLLHRGRDSRMKYFDVYLEVVECFFRKPEHIKEVPTDVRVNYKNILVFVVNNPEEFSIDVRVSVVKGLGTLSSIEIPEGLESSSYAKRCPGCRWNYMGLLAMMLVEDAVSSPRFAGEALNSITEILKNECHGVEMWELGLPLRELEELCRTFIGGGTYFSKNHFMRNLVNVFSQNPNFDKDKCILSLIMELLMEYINEENNKRVVLSDLQPETLIWFDDMLFPECNFDEEICMLLGLFNHYLNGATDESSVYGLYSSRLVDIIMFCSNLSYKFHQNSSEFTYLLKNACQYFIQDPGCYKWFIENCFWEIWALLKKIGGRSELDGRSRISIVITLIRMVDILFIDGCDPRKWVRDDVSLDVHLSWVTLGAIGEIRGFILSLRNKNQTSPQGAPSKLIQSPKSVDNSFWSLGGIDNGVGHIDRAADLLLQLNVFIFDKVLRRPRDNIYYRGIHPIAGTEDDARDRILLEKTGILGWYSGDDEIYKAVGGVGTATIGSPRCR